MSEEEIAAEKASAQEFKDLNEYVRVLEDIIIQATRKRPSTALNFLDDKADDILTRRKRIKRIVKRANK